MTDGQSPIEDAFVRVYQGSEWGKGSGPGSSPSNTIEYRAFVSRFIEANNVCSVTDLGCGDWQFSSLMDWTGIDYLGLDAVPAIIETNRSRFAHSNVRFDVSSSPADLPGGDLLLSKEVLQHLPNSVIADYLSAIERKYRFALLTNSLRPARLANVDIEPGDFRPIHLQKPPFNATGAMVFTYFSLTDTFIWKNGVFLLLGNRNTMSDLAGA